MEPLLNEIPAWWMIGIGLVLMGAELFLTVFVLLFFGLGFILIGLFSFGWHTSGEMQILSAMLIGALLTFALRKFFLKTLRPENLTLETLETGDTGELIKHQGQLRVQYKGTSWALKMPYDAALKAGDIVIVVELKNNQALVKPIMSPA